MTSVEIDTLARGYYAWNRQDIEGGVELLDPEIEWHPPAESPFPGPYKGIAAVRRFLESMLEIFDEFRREPVEFVEDGDRVIVPVKSYVRGAGSGVGLEVSLIDVWQLRDGLAVRYEVYPDTPASRAALGLERRS